MTRTTRNLIAMLSGFLLTVAVLMVFATSALAQLTAEGTATLQWTAPASFTNGDPLELEDIERFTIYYGTESGNYATSIPIENGAVQSRQVELTVTEDTTFYFAVTATARGLESDYSNEASKLVRFELGDVAPGAPQNVTLDITMSCESGEAGRTCTVVIE